VPRRRKRLDPSSFAFTAEQVRERGAAAEPVVALARDVLVADGRTPRVTVQISAERAAVVCGVDEAIALLKTGAEDWSRLVVHALYDGDRVEVAEPVLAIEGAYAEVAVLAQLCVGVLARRTRICTNVRRLTEVARVKPVAVFPGRHDHWLAGRGDGYAATVGGALAPQNGLFNLNGRGGPPVAVLPHSFIAAYGGDTAEAARHFANGVADVGADPQAQVVVPVDYENDAVRTSVEVARAFGAAGSGLEGRLWGVQLATSEYLVDRAILADMGGFPPTGVNPALVWHVRNALDAEGMGEVHILASGGFTVEKIRAYEEDGIPVDAFGVGAALFTGDYDFAADVVALDGAPQSRVGRAARVSERLDRVK
jgi:nicotinate phosphoribosyltransferase